MGAFASPSPWYFAMMATASSRRSLEMSHRGVSGKNMTMRATMPGRMHCTTVGRRHDQEESGMCLFVPYCGGQRTVFTHVNPQHKTLLTVVHPARMFPTHQKLLYIPAIVPR